jgi:SIR2-like domain
VSLNMLPELSARYREGRLLPFIGAGVSAGVSWRQDGEERTGMSWSALVEQAARMIGFDNIELLRYRGSDLQILEYFRIKKYDQFAELRNWFLKEMSPPDEALLSSPVHKALAQLTNCSLYYTTNYDDFLERSFSLHGRACRPVAVEAHIVEGLRLQSRQPDPLRCEIVKFHGDLANPERMVLSESDYEKRLRFAAVEDQRLKSDVLGRALLFLGYSFRDWNVSYLFRLVNEEFGPLPGAPSGRRAYITVVDPSDFEYSLFRARNIEVISLSSARRTEDITQLLEGLAS